MTSSNFVLEVRFKNQTPDDNDKKNYPELDRQTANEETTNYYESNQPAC